MNTIPILSILIAFPIFAAIILMFFDKMQSKKLIKYLALFLSLLELYIVLFIWYNFDSSQWMQFNELYEWISIGDLQINFILGIDGISLIFITLTAILIPLCMVASWQDITTKTTLYYSLFLITESLLMGVFSSLNILLFYIFFEAVLIPLLLIIGIWGGSKRIYATYKFFLYTFSGSILMLIAILYIVMQPCDPIANTTGLTCIGGASNMMVLGGFITEQSWQTQTWLWWFIFIGLAIKVPMWPFHTWLPYAHVQAPTGGSMLLAGILLKMGGYGMLKLLIDPFPTLSTQFADIVIILSIIGIIYASMIALVQTDMKKLIAYSSVAHMGYVTAGIFSGVAKGISGAVFQMFSHGIISAGLFLIIGILYTRTHTRKILFYSGVAKIMPKLAIFFMIILLGAIGLPGTSGFIGEFITIISCLENKFIYGCLMSSGVVLSAVYMLKLYGNIMLHETHSNLLILKDLSCREWSLLFIISFMIIVLGLYPALITIYVDNPLQYFGQFYTK